MLIQQAAQQYREEDRQRFIQLIQSEPMAAAQLRAPLYEDKVVDFLFDKAEVSEREVTREELEAAIEAEEGAAAAPAKKAPAKKAAAKKPALKKTGGDDESTGKDAAPAADNPKKAPARKTALKAEADDVTAAAAKKPAAKKTAAKKPAAKG